MLLSELPATKIPYRKQEPMPTFAHKFFVWCIITQPQNLGVIGNLTIPIDTSLDSPIYNVTERLLT
jgi:hypothetical protein